MKQPASMRVIRLIAACGFLVVATPVTALADNGERLLGKYCLECHSGRDAEAGLNLAQAVADDRFDAEVLFENIAMKRMPPSGADQPARDERAELLTWLADKDTAAAPSDFRRLTRHEFVHSINDLLGTNLNLAKRIPDDRGTNTFDSDRRIRLSAELLASYFEVADDILDSAFPADGFPDERTWVTSKLKDSHFTYNVYVRDYMDGVLFSWTRANNGNSYSFFYDGFDPPVPGWYELTFDAAKVGDFAEDVSIQVHAGKYYYADDRPQPQRLLDVLSVGERDLQPYVTRVYLRPGESISVHCYSQHTFRQKQPQQGAYIRQLTARGPLQSWPPTSFQTTFAGLPLDAPPRKRTTAGEFRTNLTRIGGSLSVSSFQQGMEKERMQDGSNRTFWHTRFKPTVAKPPHYVIVENPHAASIDGLTYATWSGGNGNGQVRKFEVAVSDNGKTWGKPIVTGDLEVRLANEQPILFPRPTTKQFIRFLVTDAVSLDGKSLASIGKLDVIVQKKRRYSRTQVGVRTTSPDDLRRVIRRFAERAFSTELSENALSQYYTPAIDHLQEHGDFALAAREGIKAVVCSHRFVMAPGEHSSESLARAAALARMLWLSVPDEGLLIAAERGFAGDGLRSEINRLLTDPKSDRMIDSFCDQWLNLRSWNTVTPSLKLYPLYDDLLHYYLPREAKAYVAHLIRENKPASHLIDSDYSFLNQRLARHYGIEGVIGQQLRRVPFPDDVPRGGLLTMGSVLKVTTDGFDTSPILRGAWVSRNLAGTPISPPPESVKAIEPQHGRQATTLREQIDQHKTNPACYACHRRIDPYGFALEHFDATGQWRAKYRVSQPHNGTFQFRLQGYYRLEGDVDASGEIDDVAFDGITGLKKVLLSDPRGIAYNFAKRFFEYANGYEPRLRQRVALLAMLDEDGDNGMKDLITNVLVYSLTGTMNE